MPPFLFDANLSPKLARHVAVTFGLDVLSLYDQQLERLPDEQVAALARRLGRVVVTLDEDFTRIFATRHGAGLGIVYLDLPNTHRSLRAIRGILEEFFRHHAASIDLEHSLVTVTDREVRVTRA